MASRGLLIRFIDIGLIALFGFLMISDIENSSRVELDSPAQPTTEQDEPSEQIYLAVHISGEGRFSVVHVETDSVLASEITSREVLLEALRGHSQDARSSGRALTLLIRPDGRSPVQRTVDVMDVCDRLGLSRSLQMEPEPGPPPTAGSAS